MKASPDNVGLEKSVTRYNLTTKFTQAVQPISPEAIQTQADSWVMGAVTIFGKDGEFPTYAWNPVSPAVQMAQSFGSLLFPYPPTD